MISLVTGAAGLLGTDLVAVLERAGHDVRPLTHAELDVTNAAAVADCLRQTRPDVVWHCAAYTAVDAAEADAERARVVNRDGARHIADACRESGARLVHFSTDFVFDGVRRTPYRPDDPPAPISVYGRTKLEGEEAVAASGADHLTVRTSWLFGRGGPNFVTAILARARRGEPLRGVSEQTGRPTWARTAAQGTLALLDAGARGVWHLADRGEASWLELAEEALMLAGLDCPIRGVSTAEWGAPAPRPAYSVLSLTATERLLGRPLPEWRDTLRRFLTENPA
jgi:dTDP-4-dehydrorhamnose reductase